MEGSFSLVAAGAEYCSAGSVKGLSGNTHNILSSPDPPSVFKGSAVSGTNQRNGNNPRIIREAD